MAKEIQRRRGTTAEHSTFTGNLAEITVDITKDTLVIHDAVSAGGFPLAREDMSNYDGTIITSFESTGIDDNSTTTAIIITSSEHVQIGDLVGATVAFNNGLEVGGATLNSTTFSQFSADANGHDVSFIKSRNVTPGSFAIVNDNDIIGSLNWFPDDGVDYQTASGRIFVEVDDGTPASGAIGTAMIFETATVAGAQIESIRIDNVQDVLISGTLNLTTGDEYQINGGSVLNATTLGSTVVISSLTTVGALASGSIVAGFGAIDIDTNNITTGGIIRIDVDGTAINAAGALSFGVDVTDSAIYFNGTNLEIDTVSAIDLSISGTAIVVIDTDGIDLPSTGDSYEIGGVVKLSNTVLESTVITSSLTTVGVLDSGSITSGFGPIDIGTSNMITTGIVTTSSVVVTDNIGTPGTNVTAVHNGDGINVTTTLTLTNVAITVGNTVSLGLGALIYTLPTGNITLHNAYIEVNLTGITTTSETPELGLGSTQASGAVATLTTASWHDYIGAVVMADSNGTVTIKYEVGEDNVLTAAVHTIYCNLADAWSANADASGLLNGTIVLQYTYNAA